MNKKSTSIEGKLLKYSAVAGAVIAGGTAEAQIMYFDVNPDYTFTNTTAGIDLNQDATADFAIMDTNVTSANLWFVGGFTLNSGAITQNAIAGSTPASYAYPFKLALNAVIDASQPWLADGGTMAYVVGGATPYSSFWLDGVVDGYMGLRLQVGTDLHYGWLRMDVPADGMSVTIKDMAYNATPNAQILAGDMGPISVSEEIASKVSIFNYNNTLTITVVDLTSNGALTIHNMNGAVVMTDNVNGSSTVDLSSLASGIYTVTINFNEGTITKKIFVR
jgi:hypothetical protein